MSETKKYTLLKLAITFTSLPLLFTVPFPESWSGDNTKAIAGYFGSVLGYVGVILLLWMYILGTRTVSGLYFKDLPRITKLHTKIGKYGMLLVFLHPLLTTYYYGEKLLIYAILPNLGTEFEKHVTIGRLAFFVLAFSWIMSALLRGKIKYRPWKYLHYLTYLVLPLVFLHVPEVGSHFDTRLVQFYWYYAVVIFLVITALRLAYFFGFGRYVFTITNHKKINDLVVMIELTPKQRIIPIKKGQYVYLAQKTFGESHPFSVLRYDDTTGVLTVAFKIFGKFTEKLAHYQVGDQVLVDGPHGVFTSQLGPKEKAVFVAGGIGITPFVQHLLEDEMGNHRLFFANQSKESAAFHTGLKSRLGDRHVDIFANDQGETSLNVEKGYISSEILSKYLGDAISSYRYFICGPKPMMQAAKSSLLALGVPEKKIHLEEFGF